ncbi:MAG TPA: hypothetical protein DCZ40_12570 [Lachnospiraceae bacterium]|nr:hypothetical protein [Lachnospiraceae bacterium]
MRLANWKLFWVKMPDNKGNDMLQNKYSLKDDIYDIIIVGGGITGIISAAVLSGTGKKVMLAERTGEYGGMFRMIEHKGEEYYFGAHHIAGICGNRRWKGQYSKAEGRERNTDVKTYCLHPIRLAFLINI